MIGEKIKAVALSYVGQTEKPGNGGFHDQAFQQKMQAVGFGKGMPWCAFFAELVWKEAYGEDKVKSLLIEKKFSGSAVQTLNNFQQAGFAPSKRPAVGALAVWRYGAGWQGHIGIVVEVAADGSFKAAEGNTNDKGGREGYIVAVKNRKTVAPFTPTGLNLIGFVLPI